MEHQDRTAQLFESGCGCAQAVLAAFCDVTGLDFETSLRLASSFGGGMGRMREVCGACTGMFMVAGLLKGYSDVTDKTLKTEHYARIQELAASFKSEFDSIICRELLQGIEFDSSPVPTDRNKEFYDKRPCKKYVEYAAKLLDEFIENECGADVSGRKED